MPEYVRVRNDVGHEFTTSRQAAESSGLTVLEKKPAVDMYGRPLPAKPNVRPRAVARPATAKNGREAAPKEESSDG